MACDLYCQPCQRVQFVGCSLQVITSLMMSLVEPSVQFLSSLEPRFCDFGSPRDVSSVGLLQVETFLCIFTTLLNDYFARGQKKLKSLEGCCVNKSALATDDSVKLTGYSVESREHIDGRSSKAVENCSYTFDVSNALKRLLALAYIWGFGSSLLNRYFIILTILV